MCGKKKVEWLRASGNKTWTKVSTCFQQWTMMSFSVSHTNENLFRFSALVKLIGMALNFFCCSYNYCIVESLVIIMLSYPSCELWMKFSCHKQKRNPHSPPIRIEHGKKKPFLLSKNITFMKINCCGKSRESAQINEMEGFGQILLRKTICVAKFKNTFHFCKFSSMFVRRIWTKHAYNIYFILETTKIEFERMNNAIENSQDAVASRKTRKLRVEEAYKLNMRWKSYQEAKTNPLESFELP